MGDPYDRDKPLDTAARLRLINSPDPADFQAVSEAADELDHLRAELQEIAGMGTSQPPAANMPESDWYRMLLFQVIRNANLAVGNFTDETRTALSEHTQEGTDE